MIDSFAQLQSVSLIEYFCNSFCKQHVGWQRYGQLADTATAPEHLRTLLRGQRQLLSDLNSAVIPGNCQGWFSIIVQPINYWHLTPGEGQPACRYRQLPPLAIDIQASKLSGFGNELARPQQSWSKAYSAASDLHAQFAEAG